MQSKFPDRLKKLREEKNLTQEQLGKLINSTDVTISRYEKGLREPDFDTLVKIADFFDVSIDFLLGREKTGTLIVKEPTANYEISRLSNLHEKIDRLPEEKQKLIETITDSFLKEEPPSDNNEQAAAGE